MDSSVTSFGVGGEHRKRQSLSLAVSSPLVVFGQAAPRTPLLRGDWLAAGASCLSNMAAPSGSVNCEEFAEFQVMGFFSCGRRAPSFVLGPCSLL